MKRIPLLAALFSIFILCFTQALANSPLSDEAITSKVKSKIMQDPLLRNTQINVNINTNNQVVSFSGVVNSESEASTLVELAQSTLDVKDVDTSDLKVKDSKQPLSDTFITAKVKGEFLREKLFGDKDISAWTINVETNNGVVYLTGTSESKTQVENAIKLAKAVSGVKEVKFRVKVARDHIDNFEMTNY